MRPHNRAGAEAVEGDAGRSTQSEPEQEPIAEDEVGGGPEKDESEDEVPLPIDEQEVPDPPEPIAMPSLETYQRNWAEKLQLHSRERRAKYSRLNLVPKPVPQLWNDCPHIPFESLKSEEAQWRLSVCRATGAFQNNTFDAGIPKYAHIRKPFF